MFRKLLLLAVYIWMFSGPPANAEELMPLREFLRTNPTPSGNDSKLYVFYRCTALFTVLTSISPNDTMRQLLEPKAYKFLALTVRSPIQKTTGFEPLSIPQDSTVWYWKRTAPIFPPKAPGASATNLAR